MFQDALDDFAYNYYIEGIFCYNNYTFTNYFNWKQNLIFEVDFKLLLSNKCQLKWRLGTDRRILYNDFKLSLSYWTKR